MKFCPKCGGLLMPTRRGNKTVLRCTKCGHELEFAAVTTQDYTIKTESSARVMTTSIVSQAPERMLRRKEELEQEKEEFYREIFLELLKEEEYGEGGEEGS